MLEPSDWVSLWISVKVAFFCLIVIVPPGLVAGYVLARKRFAGKVVLEALVYAPLVLPPVITGYLLLVLLGRKGWFGEWLESLLGVRLAFSFSGAVIAAAVMSFPLFVRSFRLAVELVDARLEVAAATLGAGPLRVFFTITLPLSLPGMVTGLTLAFARSLGEFGATIVFAGNIQGETQTLPLAVFSHLQVPGNEGQVLKLVLVSVFLCLAGLILSELGSLHLARRLGGKTS